MRIFHLLTLLNHNINRTVSILFIAFTMTLTSSCSSVLVSHDYDSSAPFSSYSLFSFAPKNSQRKSDPRADNDLINNRFFSTIEQQLQEKGYVQKEISGKVDFLVSFRYSIHPKMDLSNINTQIGFSYGSYFRSGGVGSRTCTDISEFDQGVLIIDIKDAASGSLVWRGTGSDIVSIHSTPEDISAEVIEMVATVLKPFPPQ